MSKFEEQIMQKLEKKESVEKKQITISVSMENLDLLDTIANTMTIESGENRSRNMLIDDAIDSYIKTALDIFEKNAIELSDGSEDTDFFDTVVFPAHIDGFEETFMQEKKWYYARVQAEKIPKIKYVAIYVGAPTSAITHYAEVDKSKFDNGFELVEDEKKYIIHLKANPTSLRKEVPLGESHSSSVRAPRYTTLKKLKEAFSYKDL